MMMFFILYDDIGIMSYGQADTKDQIPEGAEVLDTQEELDSLIEKLEAKAEQQLTEEFELQEQAEKEFLADFPVPVSYEYRDIWAEESGALKSNSAQYSFGNGATGYNGLPVDAGWEIEAVYFQADTYASLAKVQIDVMNYSVKASNAAANTLASITLENARDGGGDTNNAFKYLVLAEAVSIPGQVAVIGFITREVTGKISDVRVGVRLRRDLNHDN